MNPTKFRDHCYTWRKPYGTVHHQWSFTAATMAVSFHVSIFGDASPTCGLEFHRFQCPDGESAPSHTDCPIAGGRCWHDGTSLYATERLWPMIQPLLKDGDHEAVFRILEGEVR